MKKTKLEEVQSKLSEINEIITKLDPAIREAAFEILVPYYFDDQPPRISREQQKPLGNNQDSPEPIANTEDLSSFIGSFVHKQPKNNVMLLVAWLYSQYGAYPVQAKDIKKLADACGLVIPNRSDNTMRQAKDKGKNLFNQQGKGWKLTVSGELFMKNKYKVIKGNQPIPKE